MKNFIKNYLLELLGVTQIKNDIDEINRIIRVGGEVGKMSLLNGFYPPPKKCLREEGENYQFMGKEI